MAYVPRSTICDPWSATPDSQSPSRDPRPLIRNPRPIIRLHLVGLLLHLRTKMRVKYKTKIRIVLLLFLLLLLCSFFSWTGSSSFDTMVCFYIRGIEDFSFSQSGCSWRFSDGRCILLLVRLILWGTAAYGNLPPIEVVPLSINGKIVLVAIDNRRLACFVIAQIQLGNKRKVSVPVKFTCINELCGRTLRCYHRTAMMGIRRRIRIRR